MNTTHLTSTTNMLVEVDKHTQTMNGEDWMRQVGERLDQLRTLIQQNSEQKVTDEAFKQTIEHWKLLIQKQPEPDHLDTSAWS